MKLQYKKVFAVLAAMCITCCSMVTSFDRHSTPFTVEAKTLSEINAEKDDTQKQIDAKQAELEQIARQIDNQEAYQKTLQEKIDLINAKMLLIDTQIQSLQSDIAAKQAEITTLEAQIVQQQADIDKGLEEFKQRIRTIYMHGNNSMLSALVGATDF